MFFFQTQSVDIAVFPEYGLTGRVEDPTNYAISVPNAGELLPNNVSILFTYYGMRNITIDFV